MNASGALRANAFSRLHVIAGLCLALWLGAALRTFSLSAPALRGDEAFSVHAAGRPLGQMLEYMSRIDPNPPLYLVLLKGWLWLAGTSEAAARWLSVLSGVAALAVLYRLAASLAGASAARLALGLAAFNPFLIWYAQDARPYALWVALCLAAAWTTLLAARRPSARRWMLAGVLWWLALLTHYVSLLVFALVGLAFLAAPQTRPRWRGASLMAAGVALAYAPWAAYVAPFLAGHVKSWIEPLGPLEAMGRVLAVFSVGAPEAGGAGWLAWAGGALLLGLVGVGSASLFRRSAGSACWALALGPGLAAGLWLASLARPVFTEQYALAGLPGFLLIAAAGADALAKAGGWRSLAGGVGVAGLGLAAWLALQGYFFDPAFAKSPDWRMVTRYLEETAREREVVVLNLPDPAFYYYYRGSMPVEASPPDSLEVVGPAAAETQLQQLRDSYDHVRFFFQPSELYDPEGFVGGWLDACCEKLSDEFVGTFRVQTFDTPNGSLAARQPLAVDFEDGLSLTGYRLAASELYAGETAHLTLYWTARSPVATSYTVFVHLLAADGFSLADADGLPAGGRRPTTAWRAGEIVIDPHRLWLPDDLPPGAYRLEVGIYELASGVRLWATDPSGLRVDAVLLPISLRVKEG